MSKAIIVEDLRKSYGDNNVIKGIAFEVKQGEIFGLLGVNGAGKTTTLECIEGIREHDSGRIAINGKVGVQLQSSSLQAEIKVWEAVELFSRYNADNKDEIIKAHGLIDIKDKLYGSLSTGQKRRVHLALAMIGNPDIIFLDEPTAGLDVESRVALHDKIRKLKDEGKTLILASHDMTEVEKLCDRIAILKDGKIAFLGTADELTMQREKDAKLYIKLSKESDAKELNFDVLTHSIYIEKKDEYHIFSGSNLKRALLDILNILDTQDIDVVDVKIERASLEEGFMGIAKEGKHE